MDATMEGAAQASRPSVPAGDRSAGGSSQETSFGGRALDGALRGHVERAFIERDAAATNAAVIFIAALSSALSPASSPRSSPISSPKLSWRTSPPSWSSLPSAARLQQQDHHQPTSPRRWSRSWYSSLLKTSSSISVRPVSAAVGVVVCIRSSTSRFRRRRCCSRSRRRHSLSR